MCSSVVAILGLKFIPFLELRCIQNYDTNLWNLFVQHLGIFKICNFNTIVGGLYF